MSRRRRVVPCACALALALVSGAAAEEDPVAGVDGAEASDAAVGAVADPVAASAPEIDLHTVVAQRMAVNDSAAESQGRIDEISAQSDTAISVYRGTIQRIDALRSYNHQLEQLIASQEDEASVMQGEIDEVELIAREITPLMLGMIEALENFVELDVPFLAEERAVRIADLRELMGRSDVTDAERYRRIVEAYQIENEYGRTIEVYQGEVQFGGESRLVEFLRVGRVALLYQTLDGSETGVWNHRSQSWEESSESRSAVRKGIRIARKQTAPDLLRIPVPTAEARP